MSGPVLVLDHLTKRYGTHRGIEDLSLVVQPGEIFGFIGPNGAGKSTTIRTMMGLLRPTSGSATLFGKDCTRQAKEIARDVGYLPGENGYYEGLTVRAMLQFTVRLYGMDSEERIDLLADRLNLDLHRKIGELSLGNKKKIGLVSALLPSPKLLVLDEPTSGLDPLMQKTLYEILLEEKQKGTTVFLSSHILSEVQRLCDRVGILREGRLIDIQSMEDLRENGYKKIALTAREDIPKDFFRIEGVADLSQNGTTASFLFRGNTMTIMQRLHQLSLEDILIERPSLEEIFLHYYEQEVQS